MSMGLALGVGIGGVQVSGTGTPPAGETPTDLFTDENGDRLGE